MPQQCWQHGRQIAATAATPRAKQQRDVAHDFGGRIGTDWRDSQAWWPPEPAAQAGAPNVILEVLDDVGYAQLGCYGSDIERHR